MTWYPCSCGAEHDVPHCPFGAGDGNSPPSGLRETPLRAHKVGCGNALSVPVDRCACGGRDIVFEGHALASGADPRAPSVDVSAVETLIKELQVVVDRLPLSYSERFELDAEQFYRETGFMATGKSIPPEMYISQSHEDRRQEAWKRWTDAKVAKHRQLLRDLLALLTEFSSLCDRGEEVEGKRKEFQTRMDRER